MSSLSREEYKAFLALVYKMAQAVGISDIIDNIIPALAKKERFLDVGAGPAETTRELMPYFNEAVAIEPNSLLAPCYENSGIQWINQSFEDYELDEGYDLVICFHVLYHMQSAQMEFFIRKLISCVRNGGALLISMMGDRRANHDFHVDLDPNYVNSRQVKETLTRIGISYRVEERDSAFIGNNREEFAALLQFFAIEDCEKQADDALILQWVERCRVNDNRFVLDHALDRIVIFPK